MEREKGRKAQPRNGAKMGIMGTIHLVLTPGDVRQILSGQEAVIDLGNCRELCLQIETGPENRIVELNPWFDPVEAEIVVKNNLEGSPKEKHCDLYNSIGFSLIESKKSSVGIFVSVKQAKALAGLLMNYAQAWDACEVLMAEHSPI